MRRTAKPARGFTLIEVLVALLVFMVAMLGLIALQRASVAGANMGREKTAAVNLGRFVMTWLEGEAAAWPLADTNALPAAVDLPLLNQGLSAPDSWQSLSAADQRFDDYIEHSGTPLYTTGGDSAQYCVHYRVLPLGTADDPLAYQVWVRVTWPRWGQYAKDDWNACGGRLDADATVLGKYEVIELTGIVTREYTGRWTEES
jgi:prepilin-type N-terminal cleavage/methylation domain-containing protein